MLFVEDRIGEVTVLSEESVSRIGLIHFNHRMTII